MDYLLIIAVTFLTYSRSINFGYVVDDEQASRQNKHDKWWLSATKMAQLFYGAGLWKNKRLDHIQRIVLTCAIACTILYNFDNIWVALLWAVHPINNQLTLWLNGRRYQVSLLLGLLCYKHPLIGLVVYPIAVFIHPISAPIPLLSALLVTPVAILCYVPMFIFAFKRLHNWTKQRFTIQNFELYKTFNWGKPVLAVKCLAEYFKHGLFPFTFTMYHPEIWGVAELAGNRTRAYALNASFWLCLAFLGSIGYLCWLGGTSCLIGLLIACIGLLQWLGIVINPTQLWAQRYAALSSIGFCMITCGLLSLLPESYHTTGIVAVFVWYLVVTLKEMEMYRDFYSFFWMHVIHQPFNQNANYFASAGMNAYAQAASKEKRYNDTALYASTSMAMSLLWCYRNKKADLIHDLANSQLEGSKSK